VATHPDVNELRPSKRRVRLVWSLVRIFFIVLAVLVILLYAFQSRLIFPGAATQGTPGAEVVPPPGAELLALKTATGDRVAALFGPALTADGSPHPDAHRRPTFVYFYGNGMCLRDAAEYDLEPFRRLGVNVIIPDYLGYGMSGGSPSEAGCYATADAVYEHLRTRRDVDPGSIVAVGRSLGGAVAIDLAARKKLAGLVVFCTFTRMSEMAKRQFPILPMSLLLRHRFDSLSKIGRVACPVLIAHGDLDRIVPSTMSDRLAAAAAKARVTAFTVAGADHNDLYEVGSDQIFAALRRFLGEIAG
jgi:uncharacterized protein